MTSTLLKQTTTSRKKSKPKANPNFVSDFNLIGLIAEASNTRNTEVYKVLRSCLYSEYAEKLPEDCFPYDNVTAVEITELLKSTVDKEKNDRLVKLTTTSWLKKIWK